MEAIENTNICCLLLRRPHKSTGAFYFFKKLLIIEKRTQSFKRPYRSEHSLIYFSGDTITFLTKSCGT